MNRRSRRSGHPLYRRNGGRPSKKRADRRYIVPPAYAAWLASGLALHGVESHLIEKDLGAKSVEEFRADKVDFSAQPFEGRMMTALTGKWISVRIPAIVNSHSTRW